MPHCLSLLTILWLAVGSGFDLDRLMTAMAAVGERDHRFTETRTDPLLGAPIKSEGRLGWRAPDRVEKITETPAAERFVLEGTTVTLTRPGDKPRSLSINADPRLAPLVESLRAMLAGDRKGLERYFLLALTGDDTRWSVTLTPRYQSLKETLTSVVYTGHGGVIEKIVTTDAGGGVSTMRVFAP